MIEREGQPVQKEYQVRHNEYAGNHSLAHTIDKGLPFFCHEEARGEQGQQQRRRAQSDDLNIEQPAQYQGSRADRIKNEYPGHDYDLQQLCQEYQLPAGMHSGQEIEEPEDLNDESVPFAELVCDQRAQAAGSTRFIDNGVLKVLDQESLGIGDKGYIDIVGNAVFRKLADEPFFERITWRDDDRRGMDLALQQPDNVLIFPILSLERRPPFRHDHRARNPYSRIRLENSGDPFKHVALHLGVHVRAYDYFRIDIGQNMIYLIDFASLIGLNE